VLNGADAIVREPGSSGGYGLTGMRERLRLLDGTLLAGPGDNEWAVTAELPLAEANNGTAGTRDGLTGTRDDLAGTRDGLAAAEDGIAG